LSSTIIGSSVGLLHQKVVDLVFEPFEIGNMGVIPGRDVGIQPG